MLGLVSAAKLAFWAIIFVLALSFFGVSVEAIVNSPAGQANFAYVGDLLARAWEWLSGLVGPY